VREVNNEKDLTNSLKSYKRALVLFYSSWCPFCKSFLHVFDKYAKIEEKKRQDKFLRVKINGDTNPLWEKYDVKVVPTVILFEGENVLKRLDGAIGLGGSEKKLRDFLDTCPV
jgi:thioredoxin-like negative regulator of GroEL